MDPKASKLVDGVFKDECNNCDDYISSSTQEHICKVEALQKQIPSKCRTSPLPHGE